jgi:hypothetical protein
MAAIEKRTEADGAQTEATAREDQAAEAGHLVAIGTGDERARHAEYGPGRGPSAGATATRLPGATNYLSKDMSCICNPYAELEAERMPNCPIHAEFPGGLKT